MTPGYDAPPQRRTILLKPTLRGRSCAATGKVEVHEEDGWQCLIVSIQVDLADGTQLAVLLNHQPAGSVVVSDREAAWEMAASESGGMAGGLPSVDEVKTVMVATYDGTAVLTGTLPPGS